MRVSLYEQLKQKQLSFICELEKINNLIYENYSNANLYFNVAFKESPYCVYYESFDAAMTKLFDTGNNEIDYSSYRYLKDLIFATKNTYYGPQELTLNSFLNYLEFLKTLFIYENEHYDNDVDQIKKIIDYDCKKLGYDFVYDQNDDIYKVMSKHPEAEATAIIVSKNTRDKIYEYLTIRKGNVDEKRACLKTLADEIESMCKKYKDDDYYSKSWHFIQCVRHTRENPIKEFVFYYEDEEKWLDKIFNIIISILSFTKTKETIKEIKKFESKSNK